MGKFISWILVAVSAICFMVNKSYAAESEGSGTFSAGFDASVHFLFTDRIKDPIMYTVTWKPLSGLGFFNVRFGYLQGKLKVSGKTNLGYSYEGVFDSKLFYLASVLEMSVFRLYFGAGGKLLPLPSTYNFTIYVDSPYAGIEGFGFSYESFPIYGAELVTSTIDEKWAFHMGLGVFYYDIRLKLDSSNISGLPPGESLDINLGGYPVYYLMFGIDY